MTELKPELDAPSDAELIARVRGGDTAAYGELFDRHRDAADRLSRQLVRGPDSDDLVSEAFVKVLQVLQEGGGPDVALRAYLLTAVRRLHIDRIRTAQRTQPTDDVAQYDPGVPFQDTAVDGFERSATSRAFASLPERWQLVLWHLEVEGQKPADVAPLLGMSPNSVSALAYRAREGLRQAYLQMHLADTPGERCRWTTEHLGAHVRGGLARRDATKVDHHLEECRRCTGLYLELLEVNSNLRGLLAPLVLGALGPAYLASVSSGAGTAFGFSLSSVVGRLTDGVKGMSANAAVGGAVAAATVATGVAIAVVVTTGGPDGVRAEAPTVRPSPVASAPADSASPRAASPTADSSTPGPRSSASASGGFSSPAAPAPRADERSAPASEQAVEPSPAAASGAAEPDGSGDGPGGVSAGAPGSEGAPPQQGGGGDGPRGRDDSSGSGSSTGPGDGNSGGDGDGGNGDGGNEGEGSNPPHDSDDGTSHPAMDIGLTAATKVEKWSARIALLPQDEVATVRIVLRGTKGRITVDAQGSTWSCSGPGHTITCSAAGDDASRVVVQRAHGEGNLGFEAAVSAAQGGNRDPDTSNNRRTYFTTN